MDETTKFILCMCHELWPFVSEKPHFVVVVYLMWPKSEHKAPSPNLILKLLHYSHVKHNELGSLHRANIFFFTDVVIGSFWHYFQKCWNYQKNNLKENKESDETFWHISYVKVEYSKSINNLINMCQSDQGTIIFDYVLIHPWLKMYTNT